MRSKRESVRITKRDLKRHGLSQADLARALKVHRSTVSRYLKGKRTPKSEKVRKALSALHKRARRLRVTRDENVLNRRRNRIIEFLRKSLQKPVRPPTPAPPAPTPPPPPSPAQWQTLSYIDLRQFVIENLSKIKRFFVNGKLVNDTVLGWISDHGWTRKHKATQEGDESNLWRVTLDYRVMLDDDGSLYINFDPSILELE